MRQKNSLTLVIFIFVFAMSFTNNLFSNSSLGYLNRVLNESQSKRDNNITRIAGTRHLLSDNPLNYALYEKLETHIKGLDKVVSNHSDMISYYETQAGFIGGTVNILQKIRLLSLRKLSRILNDFDRSLLDNEMKELYKQILFTLKSAEFNGIRYYSGLLNDTAFKKMFREKRFFHIHNVDKALKFFISQRGQIGAKLNALRFRIRGKMIEKENNARFHNNLSTDFAKEMIELRKNHLMTLTNIFMLQKRLDHEKQRLTPLKR
ncbi:MAG: hypothetical protein OEZ36_07485 [Spirochaetota bacterium]|nr:hypothetical protein [Spirochaetota bacterium]